jgi:hypothetical protein
MAMSNHLLVIEGTLRPDGTLELDEKINLPAGRVQVIVQPLPQLPPDDPFWQRMQAMWAAQKARGHVPRSVEEIEHESRQMEAEMEREIEAAGRLQKESRQSRRESEERAGSSAG